MKLRIKEWDKHFENAASRKLKRLDWVAFPIKTDGEGYTALVDNPETAAAFFGAWCAIVEIAAKQSPRGDLPGGIPQTIGGICQSLGRMSRLPPKCFSDVLYKLLEIEWLEEVPCNVSHIGTLGESANVVGESANTSADCVTTGQDITGQDTTHTHTSVRAALPTLRKPNVTDLNGLTSQRFDEFWGRYPRQQHRDAACHQWLSVVTIEVEPAVFGCLQRYLESAEVARGAIANPEKWLLEQHRDGWTGNWPAAQQRAPERRETAMERAIAKAKEAKNGSH